MAEKVRSRSRARKEKPSHRAAQGVKKVRYIDYTLLFMVIFLLGFGMVMLYSTSAYNATLRMGDSAYYLKRQMMAAALGFAGMFVCVKMDYHIFQKLSGLAYIGSLALCVLVIFLGSGKDDSNRWFRIGGLSGVSMAQLLPALGLIAPGILIALSLHNELDVLALGREQAQALGLSARPLRLVFLALAAALAGAAVSFAGLLGFVGLVVPHMMRRLVGEESGPLLAASALGGGALLCGCDLLSRLIFAPFELPVGIVMSFLGGPFFIWLLLRQKGGRIHG